MKNKNLFVFDKGTFFVIWVLLFPLLAVVIAAILASRLPYNFEVTIAPYNITYQFVEDIWVLFVVGFVVSLLICEVLYSALIRRGRREGGDGTLYYQLANLRYAFRKIYKGAKFVEIPLPHKKTLREVELESLLRYLRLTEPEQAASKDAVEEPEEAANKDAVEEPNSKIFHAFYSSHKNLLSWQMHLVRGIAQDTGIEPEYVLKEIQRIKEEVEKELQWTGPCIKVEIEDKKELFYPLSYPNVYLHIPRLKQDDSGEYDYEYSDHC